MGQALLADIQKGLKGALMKQRIITRLIYTGCTTITDLSKSMGLSVPTVTKFIDEMCAEGYVKDCGKLETAGGRHPSLYGLNADSGYFIGVDLKKDSLSLALINFKGDVLKMKMKVDFVLENTLECVDRLANEIKSFIQSLKVNHSKILNVCIGMSGRVNPEAGYNYTRLNFGDDYPIASLLTERVGCNVCIDNDSRAMAYGELMKQTTQLEKSPKNLIFINVNWGLGMAIIFDGKLYNGMSGFSGEFGHNYGYDNQEICDCGKRGCIETEVSCSALYRKFIERLREGENSILTREKSIDEITVDDIISVVEREDVLAIELVEEIGAKLGRHVSDLINIFNPEQVIIGGELSRAGNYLLPPLISAVRRYTLNLMYPGSGIVLSELKEKANVVGSALLARSKLFALE